VTRVAIVDPQPAVRAGLVMLLRAEPGLVPVGTAAGVADAADLLARGRPDVVLLEHRLLDGDGIAFCRRIRADRRAPRVILYTASPDAELELVARVAGADGLVDRTSPADVAATLQMDRSRVAKRTERVLGRLRRVAPRAAA